ncbi:YggT family protein [Peptostreptococcus russellii]|uniref:YggT family protein n=1 Tax=Peptostreptococcus russellii TaxID=215200 RepID=UPI0016282D08|nr:YggT family protein [Peptostreptococcus russellii]MBC2577637.1 YggT family protein [Peptostreptococcus russellii]
MSILKVALQYLINIIVWVIIAKSILSWFPGAQDSKLYTVLDDFTEPVEGPIRRIFGKYMSGPFDFTPMIAIIFLMIIGGLVSRFL